MTKRYWQPIVCEICDAHLGFSPFYREEYQCTSCNDLPRDWDSLQEWMEEYQNGDGELT